MLKTIAAAACAALLAGCAAQPTMTSEEFVAQQSNYDVCRFSMGGRHSRAAEAEVARRRVDCAPFYGAIAQQRAADDALIMQLQGRQQQYRPVQVPVPQQRPAVNCTSQTIGGQTYTRCQ